MIHLFRTFSGVTPRQVSCLIGFSQITRKADTTELFFFWRETESEKLSEACVGGCAKWQADEEKTYSVMQVKLQEAKPYCRRLSRGLSRSETDVP